MIFYSDQLNLGHGHDTWQSKIQNKSYHDSALKK